MIDDNATIFGYKNGNEFEISNIDQIYNLYLEDKIFYTLKITDIGINTFNDIRNYSKNSDDYIIVVNRSNYAILYLSNEDYCLLKLKYH